MTKTLIYQVYVGEQNKLYDWCTDSVRKYAADVIGATYYCERNSILKIRPDMSRTERSKEAIERLGYLPIFEKWGCLRFIKDYDYIYLIDADIYMKNFLPQAKDLSIFLSDNLKEKTPIDICAFREYDTRYSSYLQTETHARKVKQYTKMQYENLGMTSDPNWQFYQCGFLILNCKRIYETILRDLNLDYANNLTISHIQNWIYLKEFKNFVDGIGNYKWSTDQTLINYWIYTRQLKVYCLSWIWNCLFGTMTNDKAYKEACGVHFFLKDKLPDRGNNIEALAKKIGVEL